MKGTVHKNKKGLNLVKRIAKNGKGKFILGNKITNIRCREKNADVDLNRFRGEAAALDLEEIKCSFFGCGKSLTPQEQLFGTRCQQHQKKQTTLSIIDKYLSH